MTVTDETPAEDFEDEIGQEPEDDELDEAEEAPDPEAETTELQEA